MKLEKVFTVPIRDSNSKLHQICHISLHHFLKKEALQIVVPNQAALEFVDQLLWTHPKESFLPHSTGSKPTSELLLISTEKKPLNHPLALLNLCTEPLLDVEAKWLYDLEDHTSDEKRANSEKRYSAYRQAGLLICSL